MLSSKNYVQVLITVLVNGGATTYMLRYWDLFDRAYSARPAHSPPPQRLQVLVPSRDVDDHDDDDGYHNGTKMSTTGSYAALPGHPHPNSVQGMWLVRRANTTHAVSPGVGGSHSANLTEYALPAAQASVRGSHRRLHAEPCVAHDEQNVSSEHGLRRLGRSVSCMCRNVIESIHDFQRQGGLNKQLEHLDKVFSSYLIAPGKQGDGANYTEAVDTDRPHNTDIEEQ